MTTVLHLLAPTAVGGLERVVELLAAGLATHGHEIHVGAVLERGKPAPAFLQSIASSGGHVHLLELSPRAYRRERGLIRALCQSVRPDVVHTHGYHVEVVDAGVASRLGIALVSTVHGFTGGGWKNRCYEWLQRASWRRFDAVVAVSRPLLATLAAAGVPPERLHVVPNAFASTNDGLGREAARRALGVPDKLFHVGWVGRVSREKGADVLVDAVARLASRPIVVSVVGDGAEAQATRGRAHAAGVADRFLWHGTVPDARRLFRAFDAFVLSSRTEGTPIVLLEAMMANVPVVATAVGGVPDVVPDGEALLVPPEDPASLAEALLRVIDDPAAAAGRAVAARQRLERDFQVEPWVAAYEAIYAEVKGKGRRRREMV